MAGGMSTLITGNDENVIDYIQCIENIEKHIEEEYTVTEKKYLDERSSSKKEDKNKAVFFFFGGSPGSARLPSSM